MSPEHALQPDPGHLDDAQPDPGPSGADQPAPGRPPRPAPVWPGAVAVLLLALASAVQLSYTLLDLPWQQRLGTWNYLTSFLLLAATLVPLRLIRPAPAPSAPVARGGPESPAAPS